MCSLAGAVAARLPSPWPESSSLDTDSSLLGYQPSMQGARLTAALSSRGPSACNSPYHFPGGLAQRPQLQTTSVAQSSSPVPITARLQGPSTAPAYYGARPTLSRSHGDPPAIELSPDWFSAGAQNLIGAPWKQHSGDHEGVSVTQSGDPTLATPESSTTAPLDIGPFEMDPVIQSDPSSAAGVGASASTQERPGDLLPWGQTEQTYSQGAEQSLDNGWLSKKPSLPLYWGSRLTLLLVSAGKYLTMLDAAQTLSTPTSNHSPPS